MKISTKGRYAMRLLIDLYENQGDGFVALKDIAARQDISKKYLEQIVPALTGDGILKTSRGFQGGYRLAREPEDIPVGDILRLTEGSLAITTCTQDEQNLCERYGCCTTVKVWEKINKAISDVVDNITIADLAADEQSSTNNFVI